MEELQLVDENDQEIGSAEKELCHRTPTTLHRAFSVFIFDKKGRMLIHRRAEGKKTWPGFWSNACCSHPRKGESLAEATRRRLQEELGITSPPLTHLFSFAYKVDYDEHYGENEVDHVFVGVYDGVIIPDKEEIADWRFVTISDLLHDIKVNSGQYTPWFKEALPRVLQKTGIGNGHYSAAPSDPKEL